MTAAYSLVGVTVLGVELGDRLGDHGTQTLNLGVAAQGQRVVVVVDLGAYPLVSHGHRPRVGSNQKARWRGR